MVTLEDPCYTDDEIRAAGFAPSSISGAQLVVLNTAHKQFGKPDFAAWRALGVEAVLDGRNLWERYEVEATGLLYFGIGRSAKAELR